MALNLTHQTGAAAMTATPAAARSAVVAAASSAPVMATTQAQGLQLQSMMVDPAQPQAPEAVLAGKPDIARVYQALVEGAPEAEHPDVAGEEKRKVGVPVFVMMPLDTVRKDGSGLNRRKAVQASLAALKSAGAEGIMVDVWWGIAENEAPGQYNFAGYIELMEMAKKSGLKVRAVMSFHQCGGNVGDSVTYVSSPPSLLLFASFC